MVEVTVAGESYYMNPMLKKRWDALRGDNLIKKDDDRVYVVDGRERTGKSVFALQQAAYLDPTIVKDLSRICFSADSFLEAIRRAKPGQVIVFDEAFRGLSSRGALSKVNRKIVTAMMEMGQKNLIVFIVLPSFFLLDLYVAMLRSNSLFHVFRAKSSDKRCFKVYNYKKKNRLYQNGVKKGWEYKIPTRFKDNFSNKYPGGVDFERKYRALKAEALKNIEGITETTEKEDKYIEKYHEIIKILNSELKLSYRKLEQYLKDRKIDISYRQLGNILGKTVKK